jgi:hypothetical protein
MSIALQESLTPLDDMGLIPVCGTHARRGITFCRAEQGSQAPCQPHGMSLYNGALVL